MEIILNQEALVKVLDEITLEKLIEAEKIKNEYEAKKLVLELEEGGRNINDAINECWAFCSYFNDFVKDDEYKDKTPYVYVCKYRQHDDVYNCYLDLIKQYGFDLVDKVIQGRIDKEISYLKDEEEEKE